MFEIDDEVALILLNSPRYTSTTPTPEEAEMVSRFRLGLQERFRGVDEPDAVLVPFAALDSMYKCIDYLLSAAIQLESECDRVRTERAIERGSYKKSESAIVRHFVEQLLRPRKTLQPRSGMLHANT